MTYWTETCPYCKKKTRCSSMFNNAGYGTPLIQCSACAKTYIHPDRIELAMIPEEYKKLHRRYKLVMAFVAVFVATLLIAVVSTILLFLVLDAFVSEPRVVFPIAIFGLPVVMTIVTGPKTYRRFKASYEAAYAESEKRLSDKEYKNTLIQSGYKSWV